MREMVVERGKLVANRTPVTAIVGSIDPLREGVDEMAKVMNNLELIVIEGADHLTAVRSPELVASIQKHLQIHSMESATRGPAE